MPVSLILTVDLIWTNDLGDKQLSLTIQKSLIFSRVADTEILFLTNLHGMPGSEVRTRLPQVTKHSVEYVKVSLSLVMTCCVRCEIWKAEQRCAVCAHPNARETLNLMLHEAAVENWEWKRAQEVHHISVRLHA